MYYIIFILLNKIKNYLFQIKYSHQRPEGSLSVFTTAIIIRCLSSKTTSE